MKKIINKIIQIFGKMIGKKILMLPVNQKYDHAVRSKDGFWYCGNVYDTSDIAYGISINGAVEEEETKLVQGILKQLPPGYTFLDIGANTGYYGIMSAYLFPASKTYSFEPLLVHCNLIRQSAALNKLSNVDVIECGLGEKNETMNIYTAGSGTTLIKDFTTDTGNVMQVPIRTLDEVMSEKHIESIDFIKIDVEGFEFEVLKGAKKSITSYKPIVFIEICHTKDGRDGIFENKNFHETIRYIKDLGYEAKILTPAGLMAFDESVPPAKGVWMFLFTHKDRHANI